MRTVLVIPVLVKDAEPRIDPLQLLLVAYLTGGPPGRLSCRAVSCPTSYLGPSNTQKSLPPPPPTFTLKPYLRLPIAFTSKLHLCPDLFDGDFVVLVTTMSYYLNSFTAAPLLHA